MGHDPHMAATGDPSGRSAVPRVGIGTDVHRLTEGSSLRLAGLDWPDEPRGLEGHSDADVGVYERMRARGFEPPERFVELRNGPELDAEIERIAGLA